jgi:hypothetical protein
MAKEHKSSEVKSGSSKNKWMLPTSFVLAFLFFIPFAALAGLIFGAISLQHSKNKTWPIVAIVLNLVFGFFNFLFTQIFLDVIFFS